MGKYMSKIEDFLFIIALATTLFLIADSVAMYFFFIYSQILELIGFTSIIVSTVIVLLYVRKVCMEEERIDPDACDED